MLPNMVRQKAVAIIYEFTNAHFEAISTSAQPNSCTKSRVEMSISAFQPII
uniref:Uncharacterized protein n=1 Tax=Rhizophora mucronata TaxID=61149 RepID=A0A2P2LFW7_RHIMU